jgi:uncharacterized protein YndB with AHSA1/START domain
MTTNADGMEDRIEKKILLRAPRARVWRALTDAREFGTWFGVKFDDAVFVVGTRASGKIVPTTVDENVAKAQKPYEGTPFDIDIEQMVTERLFSFHWHPGAVDPKIDYSKEPKTLVAFELEEVDGGTLLTVTESGFDRIPLARRAKAFSMNEGGWTGVMTLIEKYVGQAS